MAETLEYLEDHMYSCQFKALTGLDCPGCGFQRSFIFVLKGELMESFMLYPALIPFFITLLLLFWQLLFKKKEGGKYVMYSFVITISVIVINLGYKYSQL